MYYAFQINSANKCSKNEKKILSYFIQISEHPGLSIPKVNFKKRDAFVRHSVDLQTPLRNMELLPIVGIIILIVKIRFG